MAKKTEISYLLTAAEAAKLIRKQHGDKSLRVKFCIHLYWDMPLKDEPTKVFRDGFSASLDISKQALLKLLKDASWQHGLEDRGGRLPIRQLDYLEDIGPNARWFWIG